MQIRWKNKDAFGSVDELPDEWFGRDVVGQQCSHQVSGHGWAEMLTAHCVLTCSGDVAVLDYAADAVRALNDAAGVYTGQTVIQFVDGFRDDVVEVRWAAPDQPALNLTPPPEIEFGGAVSEGSPILATHIRYERSQALRSLKLRQSDGTCVACGMDHFAGSDLSPVLDVHHQKPVSAGRSRNSIKDLFILCPTCHRAIHKAIRQAGEPVTVAEFKQRYLAPKPAISAPPRS